MTRTVLILGGSSDIGFQVIKVFLKSNWVVILQYNKNSNAVKKLKKKYPNNLFLIKSDFSKKNSINSFIKKIKTFNISSLINLVGYIDNKSFSNINLNNMIKCLQINSLAPLLIQKNLAKKMKTNNFGRILHISSIGVKFGGGTNTFNYSLSKHLIEFIPSFMKNLVKHNVLTNILRVGVVQTKMMKKIKNKNISQRIKLIPIGRSAEKVEVANMIHFLSSEKNTYIANEKITIAGGE
tara:strand:- start:725 stop:1438 length:714 start_codon:yes stop_codon:yes gene_type:complete